MFLDASAIIAILASAPSADRLLATLDVPGRRIFCSPVARLAAAQEIADRLRRSRAGEVATAEDLAAAEDLVDRLLELVGARDVHITEGIGREARIIAAKYSAVVGHPAKLSLEDCLAAACARAYRVRLVHDADRFTLSNLE